MRACIWCTFVHWSLTFGVTGFFGPVTFEIYWPRASGYRSLLWRPGIANVNEAGLNLSAKDVPYEYKVFISIMNNDTVMWYTMHIFYI